jgi:hypothetical protein
MIRLEMMGLVAFLVSLGGTTGALVMKAPKILATPPDYADSARVPADSIQPRLATREPHTDLLLLHPDSTRNVLPDSAAHGGDAIAPGGVGISAPGAGPAAAPATPPSAGAGDMDMAYKQLGRIFSNMKTTDAAKVLAYMSDAEAQRVLQQLGVRPAARLLAALPKERAAVLSRRMLVAGGKQAVTQ